MNNDIQWSTSQSVIDVEWTMTMTTTMKETQLLAPETGVQQKLRRGFKQNSAKCLKTFS